MTANDARARERDEIEGLIARILRDCPRRVATGPDERRAQAIAAEALHSKGLTCRYHPFRFNDSAYENAALHFGIGSLGSLVSWAVPPLGALLHGAAAASYWLDSTRKVFLLRRLLGFRDAQNLVATLPAEGRPALRVVFLAHADAAFTGLTFHPKMIKTFTGPPQPRLGLLHRPLALATRLQATQAALDLVRSFLGPLSLAFVPLDLLLAAPGFLTFAFALEVALRNEIVPGANDNLTGVAALPALAARLAPVKPPEVELVFVVTGCEEAQLGGSAALARDQADRWERERTVVVALDSLCGGDLLFIHREGEVQGQDVPRWLSGLVLQVAASEPRFAEVEGFDVPAGGSDAAPFLCAGWDAVALTCVDRTIGAPRHYHRPSDTLENLDMDKVQFSVDFAERFTNALIDYRLGR